MVPCGEYKPKPVIPYWILNDWIGKNALDSVQFHVTFNESGNDEPPIVVGFEQNGNVVKLYDNANDVSPFAQFA